MKSLNTLSLCFAFSGTLIGAAIAQDIQPAAALQQSLRTAAVGSVLPLGLSGSLPASAILNNGSNRLVDSGSSLLYSDDPESIKVPGILYKDTLPAGVQRVYLYHTNELTAPGGLRVTGVLENTSAEPVTVTYRKVVFPTPSGDYLAVGRQMSADFYTQVLVRPPVVIAPGVRVLLDPSLDARVITQAQLVGAVVEYEATGALKVTAAGVLPGVDTLATIPTMPQSPNDAFKRQGTFAKSARSNGTPFNYNTATGYRRLRVADGGTINADPPITGTDAERATPTTLPGNYGVTYRISINARSTDGRAMALMINPRGGAYGAYFPTTLSTETTPVGAIVPGGTATLSANTDAGLIRKFTLSPTAQNIVLEFTPAGATSLPIEFLLVPFDSGAKATGVQVSVAKPAITMREQWGSVPQQIPESRRQQPSLITLHHAGELWKLTDDPIKKLKGLQKFGQNQKNWPDLPYHFLIAPDGRIFQGRDVGFEPESNTKYQKNGHIGINLWGNFEEQRVTEAQLRSVVSLSAWLSQEYGISPSTIAGHKDHAETLCPGKDYHRYIADGTIRKWVEETIAGKSPKITPKAPLDGGPTVYAGALPK